MDATLAPLDWLMIGGYGVVLLVSGWWFSRRQQNDAGDYFLAGRSMPMWAVAVSTAATAISAATFIGLPGQSYAGNLTYLATNLGAIVAILLVAFIFIPAYYRANVTTVYGLLERTLGPGARTGASIAFLVGRVLASGSRVYIAAIPAAMILFHAQPGAISVQAELLSIGLLTGVGIAYTLIGGVRSVIWTDSIQTLIFVGAAVVALVLLLGMINLPIPAIWHALQNTPLQGSESKATIFSTSLDPAKPYTLWASLIGMMLLYIAAYGTDHDLTQRMLTCSTPTKGGRSAMIAILLQIPIIALFLALGSLLWILYQRPDLTGRVEEAGAVVSARDVFVTFIATKTPAGMPGLILAGLYAAALSTLNSGLNAMGATLYADVYKRACPRVPARFDVLAGRIAVVIAGLAVGGFAALCVWWQRHDPGTTLIDLALSVMTFAYAGLLAVFVSAILTRRGNSASAIGALVTGFVVIAALQPAWIGVWTSPFPALAPTPDIADDWRLGELRLAFPWQLTIGFVAAFAVCQAGTRPKAAARHPKGES
jgi:SSS family transporter